MNHLTRLFPAATLLVFLFSCQKPAGADEKAETPAIRYAAPSNPAFPFSKAVRAGDFVYVSGQIGTNAEGKLADGFEAQSRQIMDNIREILNEQGLSMNDVVKCTVMIGDMSKWPAFNTIYKEYFTPGKYPARSAFGANGLAMGAEIEVDAIAYAPLAKSK